MEQKMTKKRKEEKMMRDRKELNAYNNNTKS